MRSGYAAPTTLGVISLKTRIANAAAPVAIDERELAVAEVPARDLADEQRRRRVDHVVAEQHDAEELVGVREQIGGEPRAAVAAAGRDGAAGSG